MALISCSLYFVVSEIIFLELLAATVIAPIPGNENLSPIIALLLPPIHNSKSAQFWSYEGLWRGSSSNLLKFRSEILRVQNVEMVWLFCLGAGWVKVLENEEEEGE